MKKQGLLIILLGIVFFVIYLSFKLKNDENDNIRRDHYDVTGTITNVGLKTIDISYVVNDQSYTYTRSKPYKGINAGEEFYTMAYKKDLSRALVFFTKPVIDTAKYTFLLIKPTEVEALIIDNDELLYSYTVGGEEYERIEEFDDGKRPENFEKMKVAYRADNPGISYLVEEK